MRAIEEIKEATIQKEKEKLEKIDAIIQQKEIELECLRKESIRLFYILKDDNAI